MYGKGNQAPSARRHWARTVPSFLRAHTHIYTALVLLSLLLLKRHGHTLAVAVLVKKRKREGGYLLYSLNEEVSHCKKEWLHSPVSFHPFPSGTLPLSHRGHRTSNLLRTLHWSNTWELPATGLGKKNKRRRRKGRGGMGVNRRYDETKQSVVWNRGLQLKWVEGDCYQCHFIGGPNQGRIMGNILEEVFFVQYKFKYGIILQCKHWSVLIVENNTHIFKKKLPQGHIWNYY